MHFVTKHVRESLLANFDEKRVKGAQLFFKECFKGYGAPKSRIKLFMFEALSKNPILPRS